MLCIYCTRIHVLGVCVCVCVCVCMCVCACVCVCVCGVHLFVGPVHVDCMRASGHLTLSCAML